MKCDFCEEEFDHRDLQCRNKQFFCEDCLGLLGEEWDFCRNCNEAIPINELNGNVGLCDGCYDAFNEYMENEVCGKDEDCQECKDYDELRGCQCINEQCWLRNLEIWLEED
jgi:hypothetical protein